MAKGIVVTVKYRAGHSYDRTMVPTDLFCPSCARMQVWVEDSDGDYYQGPDYVCTWCGASFNIQGPTLPTKNTPLDDPMGQIVEALRAANAQG